MQTVPVTHEITVPVRRMQPQTHTITETIMDSVPVSHEVTYPVQRTQPQTRTITETVMQTVPVTREISVPVRRTRQQAQTVMETVVQTVPVQKAYTVRVVRYRQEARSVPVRRAVDEVVSEVVMRTESYCVNVPYQETIRVPVYTGGSSVGAPAEYEGTPGIGEGAAPCGDHESGCK